MMSTPLPRCIPPIKDAEPPPMTDLFHVMVIEDDEADFQLLASAFRSLGVPCVLDWQKNGEFGVRALIDASRENRRPEVVVIDLDLPGMRGDEVLRVIRKNSELRSIVALTLTGSSAPQDRVLCALADSYLTKPILHAGWREIAYLISEWAILKKKPDDIAPRIVSSSIPNLLHVDDDVDDRQLFSRAFIKSGLPGILHTMSGARDALSYLNRCGSCPEAVRPCLIVCDLSMPQIVGRNLLDLIKTNRLYQNIPVIVLSGSPDFGDIHRCKVLGADDYVVKPSTYQGLIDVVRSFEPWLTGAASGFPIMPGAA
jgi:CheY-like chemotaxis protein